MRVRPVLVASLGIMIGACSGRISAPKLVQLPDGAQPEIMVAGARLVLETELWRDFMPIAPPDGRPLAATLGVRSVNGMPLPPGLAMTSATVYYKGETWQAVPEVIPTDDPTRLLARIDGGPKWGPGVAVDVVVALQLGGERMLLGAADQPIGRTD